MMAQVPPVLPPVLLHRTWRHLLRAIESPQNRTLISAAMSIKLDSESRYAHLALASVALLARAIALKAPPLLDGSPLAVTVVVENDLDALDGGAWYGLLPELLGIQSEVHVTLVGPEETHHPGMAELCRAIGGAPMTPDASSIEQYPGTLATYIAAGSAPHILGYPESGVGSGSLGLCSYHFQRMDFGVGRLSGCARVKVGFQCGFAQGAE